MKIPITLTTLDPLSLAPIYHKEFITDCNPDKQTLIVTSKDTDYEVSFEDFNKFHKPNFIVGHNLMIP
jgi:hypothetical protein